MRTLFYGAILALAVAASGCGENPNFVSKTADYEGYKVTIRQDSRKRLINIEDTKSGAEVCASDMPPCDGRFDQIRLYDVKEDDKLEEYASLERLEGVFEAVKNPSKPLDGRIGPYNVKLRIYRNKRRMEISDPKTGEKLIAMGDLYKFNRIDLTDVKMGSGLEILLNPEELEKAYNCT